MEPEEIDQDIGAFAGAVAGTRPFYQSRKG